MKKSILIITIFIAILAVGISAGIWNAKTGAPKNGLVAHWTMDVDDINGTELYDKSGNDNSCTLVNTPTQSEGRIEGALDFDSGSSEYLNCGSKSEFNFTNGITVSLWIKGDTQTGNYVDIFKKNDAYSMQTWSNYPGFEPKIGASYYHANDTITLDSMKGTWYHLVGTYDGETVKYYRDAVLIDTNTDPSGPIATSGNSLVIAQATYGGDAYFNGSIDDVRAYNRALSAQEISQLYNATSRNYKNSETKKGLIGHWTMDANDITSSTVVYDKSGNNYNGTLIKPGSNPTSTLGKIEEAVEFDGNSDYVNLGTQNLGINTTVSFSAWVNADALDSDFHMILAKRDANANYPYLFYVDNSNNLKVGSNDLTPAGGGDKAFSLGWHHVVGTIDTSSGYQVYIDGVAGSKTTISAGTIAEGGENLMIGANQITGSIDDYFDGEIDDVRVYDYILSAQEVSELYNSAKTQFTASAPKNGLVLYYKMDANDINGTTIYDKSGNALNGTLVNSPGTGVEGKINEGVEFFGTNNVNISVPYNSLLKDNDSFTVSAWVYVHSNTGGKIAMNGISFNANFIFWAASTGSGIGFDGSGGWVNADSAGVALNNWHFLVGKYDGDNLYFYIDGVLKDTQPTGGNIPDTDSSGMKIGTYFQGDGPMDGIIDDFRFYNRALSAEEIAQLYKSSARSYVK